MTEGTPTANAAPQNQPLRLGDLLTSAGLLKAEELRQAMLIAKSQGLPVGRVIIMSGFMSENNLQAAVQCQSLLKDGILSAEIAVNALRTLHRENISLDEALQKLSVNLNQSGNSTNKLGELLIEAGILTKAQLDDALAHGKSSGLPLGRVLVVTNIISEQLLASALNAQILIRDKTGRARTSD
jgi:alkylated DNA nucleotide flippase Atl1